MEACRWDMCVLLRNTRPQTWQPKTALVSYLAVSVSGVWAGVGWNWGPAEAGMGSALPPSPLRLLAEFISLWL